MLAIYGIDTQFYWTILSLLNIKTKRLIWDNDSPMPPAHWDITILKDRFFRKLIQKCEMITHHYYHVVGTLGQKTVKKSTNFHISNPKTYLPVSKCIQNLVKIHWYLLKLLPGNKTTDRWSDGHRDGQHETMIPPPPPLPPKCVTGYKKRIGLHSYR